MKLFFFLLTFVVFLIPFSTSAFAQASYDINIPTGAASSDAPYFWQSEKDGSTSGDVEILVGDTIVWKNADTFAHTATSGIISEGGDGIFDSNILGPGTSYSHKFTEAGHYPYFCLLHPWMTGTVVVTDGYSIIPNVGREFDDDDEEGFAVEYDFNRLLSTATVDKDQKAITFEIIGEPRSENNELELRLDPGLIDGPFVIWVDGEKIDDFESIPEDNLNVLFIPLDSESQTLTIAGTTIVPEFGSTALIVLGVSVTSVIVLSQKFRLKI